MKISFDFDDTLTRGDMQLEAQRLRRGGHTTCVVTQRYESEMDEYFNYVVNTSGIDEVYCTNRQDKWMKLDEIGADVHYDNDARQVELINQMCKKTIGYKVK
jgi:hypothetical protein